MPRDVLVNESRPLLSGQRDAEAQKSEALHYTPLPKAQLGILCYLRLLDPLNFSQIFPYINQYVTTLRLTDDPSQVGLYSGLVESTFALFQLFAIYPWASMSDRIGRRPVILAGVAGLTVTTIMFGLSRSFIMILVARALAGLSSGNVSVIPSILCDITDSTNQSVAFPFLGIWYPMGAILGSLIGGSFALRPSADHPLYGFLEEFPCFLPCFIVAVVNLAGFLISFVGLKESLQATDVNSHAENHGYGFKQLLKTPIIHALCTSGCCLGFVATAFDVVFVLFCYSPISGGGLGLSVAEIGCALAISSASSAILQMFFMPFALKRFDHFKLYDFFMNCWPLVFLGFPVLHAIAKLSVVEQPGHIRADHSVGLWLALGMVLAMSKLACLAYAVNALLAKTSAPNPAALGSTMGLLQLSTCLPRAFSPAFVSSAFSFSVRNNILWGYCWVVIMIGIATLGLFLSKKVVMASQSLKYA